PHTPAEKRRVIPAQQELSWRGCDRRGLQTPARPIRFGLTTHLLCQRWCTQHQRACRGVVHLCTEERAMPHGGDGMAYRVQNSCLALEDVVRGDMHRNLSCGGPQEPWS